MEHRSQPASIRRFALHYAEMVVAMIAGMVVLGLPLEGALVAAGTSSSAFQDDAPSLALLGMAAIMTLPMVGWMRYRGHGWQPCAEMSASMFLPTFAVIGLMWGGVVEGFATLMAIEHAAMLPAMLVAMLLRPREYACSGHHRRAPLALRTRLAALGR